MASALPLNRPRSLGMSGWLSVCSLDGFLGEGEAASVFPTLPSRLCHPAGGGSAPLACAGCWPPWLPRLLLPGELPGCILPSGRCVLLKWQPFGHRGITLQAAFCLPPGSASMAIVRS